MQFLHISGVTIPLHAIPLITLDGTAIKLPGFERGITKGPKLYEAVELFFSGQLPLYPGYNGIVYDLQKGYAEYLAAKPAPIQSDPAPIPVASQALPNPPAAVVSAPGLKPLVPMLDVRKIRQTIQQAELRRGDG